VVTPAAPNVAPATLPAFDSSDGVIEGRFTCIYNVTGAPALVIPCGYSGGGLPIGIQLSARLEADMKLLRAASRVESVFKFQRRANSVRSSGAV
jgi:Asp-tRNA(Asn)/Glu-tRNA(Gln) amidotransferase A subunit family amidase